MPALPRLSLLRWRLKRRGGCGVLPLRWRLPLRLPRCYFMSLAHPPSGVNSITSTSSSPTTQPSCSGGM